MQVIQVNAGPLKPLPVQGDTVQTGFFKTPRSGPVRVSMMGLEGDERVYANGNPHRAVFFYQAHYYDFWRRELKRDIPYSMLGENITLDGWDDEKFCVGDELQIGSVRLRITQPRHPCIKLGERVGDPSFPIKYMKALRLGFHCMVLEEGTLEAGDEVRLVHRANNPLQLHEFTKPVFINPSDIAGLEKILACPEVVPELRIYVERVWRKHSGRLEGWREYRPLKVANHRMECDDVVSFDLQNPSGADLPVFDAGQFLTMQIELAGEQPTAVRTYTIAGRSADGKGYSFAVKREIRDDGTLGLVSSHLMDKTKAGNVINALPPRGHFIVEPGNRPVVLLSAGIGVTPMLAMLEQLKADTLDRQVFFIHGARNSKEHILAEKVREIVAGWKKATTFIKYSQPASDDVSAARADGFGRIEFDDIRRLVPSLEADFYVCGPASFIRDFVPKLVEEGVAKERIKYEFFGSAVPLFKSETEIPPGDPVLDREGKPIMVTFAKAGISVPWTDNMPSLLVLAERNGLQPPQLCRNGLCEACVCRLDDGEVMHEGDILNPPPSGEVMICCAKPVTSVMVDA